MLYILLTILSSTIVAIDGHTSDVVLAGRRPDAPHRRIRRPRVQAQLSILMSGPLHDATFRTRQTINGSHCGACPLES